MSSLERIATNIVSDYKALQNSSDTDEKAVQMRKTSLINWWLPMD